MSLPHQVETNISNSDDSPVPNTTFHSSKLCKAGCVWRQREALLFPTWETQMHSQGYGKEAAPRKNIFTFQVRFTNIQQCYAEPLRQRGLISLRGGWQLGSFCWNLCWLQAASTKWGLAILSGLHSFSEHHDGAPWEKVGRGNGREKDKVNAGLRLAMFYHLLFSFCVAPVQAVHHCPGISSWEAEQLSSVPTFSPYL